jgi:hypothetical protein
MKQAIRGFALPRDWVATLMPVMAALLLALCCVGTTPARAAAGPPGCKEILVNGLAQPTPQCLDESAIKVCEAELTRDLALEIERFRKMAVDFGPQGRSRKFKDPSTADSYYRTGVETAERLSKMSILQYALSTPPYKPLYDLNGTREFMVSVKKNLAALQSGDEDQMAKVIGMPYRGRELEMRLAGDERFLCMLNLRLAQLTRKYPTRTEPK